MLNALRLAENRMLAEQLRLIYGNISVSFLPMFPAIFVLAWAISSPENIVGLMVWVSIVSLTTGHAIFDARRRIKNGFLDSEAPDLTRKLIIMMALDGAAWGSLSFGVLGNTTPVGAIVVICVLAGILGGMVGLLAPILPVFVAVSIPLVGLTAAKLVQLDDPAYTAFGVIAVMYLLTLIAQTHNSSKATRAAIELRFENLELVRETHEARLQAEQANTAKTKFLAAASHDLRQPVFAQGLFLEVLSRTNLTQHQADILASARSASTASSEMLSTLLDFSRIEADVVEPVMVPFQLQPIFDKIQNDLMPIAITKGIAYRCHKTSAIAESDGALVELVLRNLVSNAIRYTERGGLLVACRQCGPSLVVEVWDTGIGIAPENHEAIFREFHQLGNPERDRRKGLGLGLAIADGFAKVLGQRLTVKSRPGRGSCFRLPLPRGVNRQSAALDSSLVPATISLTGLRALVIDDDEAVLLGMTQLLRSWGCSVETAESIEQAQELARARRPDVVLTDYRLRGHRTGLQAISILRQQLGQTLPVLMLTGDTAPDRLRETLSSGVPLLHKPISPAQLLQTLTTLINRT